uniref:Transthyretin-like family protein n=1 Tax=Panagrolaimus sp. PS1159 TaxID=55785 RepID=A0AC35GTE4_9BILA
MKLFLIVFVLAAFQLYYVKGFQYTSIERGDYKFYGLVKCANGNPIQNEATVRLMERDDVTSDDLMSFDKVQSNGKFFLTTIEADDDWPTPRWELYLQFLDVCEKGEYKLSGFVKPDTSNTGYTTTYTITPNDVFAEVYGL